MFESCLFLYLCMRLLSYIPTVLLISTIVSALAYILLPDSAHTWQIVFFPLLGFTWVSHVLVSQFQRLLPLTKQVPQISLSLSMSIWLFYFAFFLLATLVLQRIQPKSFSIGVWLFLTLLCYQVASQLEKSLL
jgi:hypothetical protein